MSNIHDVRRREIKYRVAFDNASRAKQYIGKVLQGDPHNGSDGYLVRSLYFDTLWNRDLEEKKNGLESRRKIRLRVYSPEATTAKLELKEKQGLWQHKRSITIPRDMALHLTTGDYTSLARMQLPLAQQLYRFMSEQMYRPKCIVQYRRYAFIVPANDIRITFDSKLMATEGYLDLYRDDAFLYPVGWPDDVTLEVKYNHFLFSYIKDLLDDIDKVPVSYSKYVMSRFMTHSLE